MGGSSGGTDGPDPPGKSQKYRVFSITGLDLLENHKATMPAFHDASHHWPASETPFKWPPLKLVVFGSSPHLIN